MVSVELTAKGKRRTVLADEKTSVGVFLEENGVDVRLTPPALNGSMLDADELEYSFADLGVGKSCLLTCVVKTSNA